jgi:putative membrane protein
LLCDTGTASCDPATTTQSLTMIVRPRPNWFRMLLVVRGSVLPVILPQLLLTLAFGLLVTLFHGRILVWKVSLTFVPFSLIGLTLAIFLGFRNNTSYARYWEARVLWGEVLNDTRSLARQALTLVDTTSQSTVFVYRLIAFVHALRHQLRDTDPSTDLARWLSESDRARLARALQALRHPAAGRRVVARPPS